MSRSHYTSPVSGRGQDKSIWFARTLLSGAAMAQYYICMIGSFWGCALAGTVLIVVATWVGWATAESESFALVRLVKWWLTRVVLPHLTARLWVHRAAVIAANNLLILLGLMALGRWLVPVLVGIALCGVSMGIALRLLPDLPGGIGLPAVGGGPGSSWRMRVGVILNLLEPPAIAFALGLAIGISASPTPPGQAWGVFLIGVVPAMLVAAGGEALWLGVLVEAREREIRAEADAEDLSEDR